MAAKSQAQGSPRQADIADPQLARYLFQAEEAERRRLARELHDETSQGLTLVRFYLGALQEEAGTKAKRTVDDAFNVLDRTIEGLRRIVSRLSPQTLEQLGLAGSILKEARSLEADLGIQVKVRIAEKFGTLSAETELAIYRLVQEALHNVAKHAQAKNVDIDLSRKEGRIRLVIQDDGVGLPKKAGFQHHSFGIVGMRERVRCLNGTFRMRSRHGRGTRIEVFLRPDCGSTASEDQSTQLQLVEGRMPARSRASNRQQRNFQGVDDDQNPVPARG
jgi:signal transduction histidine kinase